MQPAYHQQYQVFAASYSLIEKTSLLGVPPKQHQRREKAPPNCTLDRTQPNWKICAADTLNHLTVARLMLIFLTWRVFIA